MKTRVLTYALALSCTLAVAANAGSGEKLVKSGPLADSDHVIYSVAKGADAGLTAKAAVQNLTNHGGPTLTSAKVVFIFWGFGASGDAYTAEIQAFRNQFGTTGEYNTITQYSGIQLANLASGTADGFDTTAVPTNVTDALVQGAVTRYLSTHAFNGSTIYEVVIPSTSFSSSGNSTSCGGPQLAYCAYHGHFASGANDVKYSIEPYPSCSGCQAAGFTVAQNQEHFVCHETREAVTDPDLNAWFDRRGNEADDKCAWTPAPFIGSGGFGYQWEWSNLNSACIKTR